MKKLLNQKSIKAVTIEMLSIVAAVLIALGVSEWNQNRTHQQNAEAALQKIISEMAQNFKIVQSAHKNNQLIVDNLDNPEYEGQFIPALQIQDTAWQTALSTGSAEHISYDTLFALSKVYALQEMYKSFTYELVQAMMRTNAMAIAINPNMQSTDDVPSDSFNEYFVLVNNLELALLAGYKTTPKNLKAKDDKNPSSPAAKTTPKQSQ